MKTCSIKEKKSQKGIFKITFSSAISSERLIKFRFVNETKKNEFQAALRVILEPIVANFCPAPTLKKNKQPERQSSKENQIRESKILGPRASEGYQKRLSEEMKKVEENERMETTARKKSQEVPIKKENFVLVDVKGEMMFFTNDKSFGTGMAAKIKDWEVLCILAIELSDFLTSFYGDESNSLFRMIARTIIAIWLVSLITLYSTKYLKKTKYKLKAKFFIKKALSKETLMDFLENEKTFRKWNSLLPSESTNPLPLTLYGFKNSHWTKNNNPLIRQKANSVFF